MQNLTSTATAPTKCGLRLDQNTFKFAIQKALALKPKVQYVSLKSSMIETENHQNFVSVSFTLFEDGLWVTCACQFHAFSRNPHDVPRACFHAAAAALERNLFAVPQPIGAMVEEKQLESLAYDAVERAEAAAARFRPKLEAVEREQAFNWKAYRRTPEAQLHEGWEV